jgi:mRNA-degrading endonuclease RelE of RelBE toxin-antitoxin system
MRLLWEQSALAELQALPPGPRSAIRKALEALESDDGDKPEGLDVKRLVWRTPMFRLRVGAYRVAFARDGRAHRVLKVFHRSEGYGWLERLG